MTNSANKSAAKGASKALIATLTILALVVAGLVGVIALNSGKDKGIKDAETTATSTSTSSVKPPADVDPQMKALIDTLHRKQADDPRAKGELTAPVVMEVWGDFRCSHCQTFALQTAPELQSLIDDGTVRIEWNNMPVLGDESTFAAQASTAAANQGKFWEFHDILYSAQVDGQAITYDEAGMEKVAKAAGVADLAKFKTDLTSAETVAAVKAEYDKATSMGITGTPSFTVGYVYIPRGVDADTFKGYIASEALRPAK